jgi:hypothetical protein
VIWNAASGKPVVNGLLHQQSVRNVEFSPDGTKLLTSSFDGLRLWDSLSGHPLSAGLPHQIAGGTGFHSNCGLFSPDGTTILQANDAYEAIVWKFPDPQEDVPAWFPELLEAVARQRIAVETLRPETIGPENFLRIASRLRHSDATDFYTTWAKRWME